MSAVSPATFVLRQRARMRTAQRWIVSCIWLSVCASILLPSDFAAGFEPPCRTGYRQDELTAQQIEFFEKSVRPILVDNCYECHSGSEISGGLLLDSAQGVQQGGDSGPAIVPGAPQESLLVEAIGYKNRDLQMPPDGPLAEDEIATLVRWIKQGAPDPRTATPTGPEDSSRPLTIAEGKEFWSFTPVADPEIPRFEDSSWIRSPIDAFVLRRLREAGLEPAPPADKRTLLRRITYDLIGLPPTVDEIDAFLHDDSADAFERVVDRLLNSPHYGVRWGRHWLDVARYADSNGLDENLAYGTAWRYRDYVIASFNSDKPFDRFMTEQIAGDLIPGADRETRTATGFLALGAKVLAEPDMEKLVMDTIDEQIDTTGKAFLGMTLGCARCHDHKFDPLLQADYYALAAIFKSTRTFATTRTGVIKHWYEHPFTTVDESQRIQELDATVARLKSEAASFKNAEMTRLREEARSRVVAYLVAATQFELDASLDEIATIAAPRGLHPRILHHCRRHLSFHRDDPIFRPWHEFVSQNDVDGLTSHYQRLFRPVEEKESPAGQVSESDELDTELRQAAEAALKDATGLLAVPPQPEFAFDSITLEEYYRLAEKARVFESGADDPDHAMGVSEQTVLEAIPIHIRGSHLNLGEPIAREFPHVMRTSTIRPIFPHDQSGRLELANWLASTQHPLTARVYVNRIWRWHFGAGLVRSTENFGVLGDRPSHPELLDWLARRFMEGGWSTKRLHRLLVLSNSYQLSSTHPSSDSADSVDPQNRLLWKFPMQRLEVEQVRDGMLAVAGRLDREIGGKTVPLRNKQFVFDHTSIDHTQYGSLRRAAYLPVIRNNLYPMFAQFDFPDPTMPTGSRNVTTVAPQALLLMNYSLVMDSADAFAADLIEREPNSEARIQLAYHRAFGRPASSSETERARAFITGLMNNLPPNEVIGEHVAWSMFCQSLFAANEFVYIR